MWQGQDARVAAVNSSFPLSSAIQCIESMQAYLAEPLLVLEWESSIPEVDTWMVEWLPETTESKFSALSWESVSQVTNWTIEQGMTSLVRDLVSFKSAFKFFLKAVNRKTALGKLSYCHGSYHFPGKAGTEVNTILSTPVNGETGNKDVH